MSNADEIDKRVEGKELAAVGEPAERLSCSLSMTIDAFKLLDLLEGM